MKIKVLLIVFFLLIISSVKIVAQNPPKKVSPEKISDIPHKTLWEKWMWGHRSAVFVLIKERPINYDTAYIKSYYKRLVLTLPVSTRFLQFSLIDVKTGNRLTFVPNLQYNLGISVSSRWVSFILNSGVKLFNGNTATKGKTEYKDLQLNIYGRKFTTDMYFQYYKGFFIRNSRSYDNYISDSSYSIRSDVKALHMGASTYYILNHKKFSYGSVFSFVEQQKKSAGSLLLGIYYSYLEAKGNPSLVNYPFSTSFDTLSLIRTGNTHHFGLNLGYIYTWVFFKKFCVTASLAQGIGAEQVFYTRNNNSRYYKLNGGAGKLHGRLALRYGNGRYFIGGMGMFDYFLFSGKSNSTFNYSYGKIMVYIGYRFSVLKKEKKLLRKLSLIDY
ncbi:MAG: DUF4421 family protein [Bacteroidetes bacterium]|nr:DUF4421 family protein [Bacteroidota bacterium]